VTRAAYIDGIAGLAGDMLLAALLDAGADEHAINKQLRSLPVGEFRLARSRTRRHGLSATRVEIIAPDDDARRRWSEVRELIATAALPERARRRAQEAFRRLAVAEGRVHGVDPEQVHFHEVGALDAILDVCGVALALEDLAVAQVYCSALPAPRGFVNSAHGRLPLPAPATLELLRGAPLYGVELDGELVTPTGAALATSLATDFGPLPPMRLDVVGYGAGAREIPEIPNVCRVLVGELVSSGAAKTFPSRRTLSLIETNLDDIPSELVPDAAVSCFAAGALDVWTTPVQMKKGRPGIVLSALTPRGEERDVVEAMLRETTTLGVRVGSVERWELEREERTVVVAGHAVRVKVGRLDGDVVNLAPEHDDCVALAARTGKTVKAVWAAAFAAAQSQGRDAD
jgi:uncharacterized protein (TIGR00299 family) protein